ncbi:MAG: TonB-dependent receptor [Capnocytophaga sp.]|nr:TonB-dependent receptor [Capnocytophaga sp.]
MKFYVLVCSLLFTTVGFAQSSSITGVVSDKEMGNEPLPFANVIIKGSNKGTTTDMDGVYRINNVAPGTYTLQFSFVGYETIEIPNVKVEAGKDTKVNASLGADNVSLSEVVVETTVNRESENTLLLEQKKAVEIKQNIGAQELSRKGLSDVASAVAKTSGISKQEGTNNIYVRGLGDRYNSTSMNGLPIPSNDPEKKNIALDLFSSDIVEYISIDKVYNAKIFGDFGGGNVDIFSKNYSGSGLLEISLGSKINTNAINKSGDFMLQEGPNAFGFSNYWIPNNPLNQYAFTNSLKPVSKYPLAGGLGIKAGKSYTIGAVSRLNLFATANFDNGFGYREGLNRYSNAQGYRLKDFQHQKFSYTTNTTGMFNANLRLNQNNRFSYNFLFINSSDQSRDIYTGNQEDRAPNLYIQRSTYTQNTILTNQLLGNHKLGEKNAFDWGFSYGTVTSKMPDRTQNMLNYFENASGTNKYMFSQNSPSDNNRFYQKLEENELALNLELSRKLGSDDVNPKGKISVGYQGRLKKRDFEATQFNFNIPGRANIYVDADNLDDFFNQSNYAAGAFTINTFAGFLNAEKYWGEQLINAGFATVEYRLSERLSGIAGLRFDRISQTVEWDTRFDSEKKGSTFERNEFLPNIVLKYELNEKQNLRFGASKTYTLPQFKERGRFPFEDIMETKIGNPDLYPSENYNADLKWELFPKREELISLTLFGKYIKNPINEVVVASASNDISWVNISDAGHVYGVEVEIRKHLFDTDDNLRNRLTIGLNMAYMKTHQELDSDKVRRENRTSNLSINLTDSSSGFTGASDLLANADLTYAKYWKENVGITTTLMYSYFSDRIYALSAEQVGNFIDKGVGTFDFILKTELGKNVAVDFNARNLLNPEYKRIQDNATGVADAMRYKRGTSLSLGITYKF